MGQKGSAPAYYCPAEGRVRHSAHLAGMLHSRKSRVATLRQSSTPWPRSHFSTVISVAGEGRTRSRSCSTVKYLPAGTRGQRAARSAAGPGRQVQLLPYCGERGSDTARTRRARRSVPRCRSARVSCTPCSGLTRPARTHPGGGLRADRERRGRTVSGAGGAGGTAPSRSAQNGTYRNGWSRSSARPATQQLQAAAHSASTAGSARHLRWAEGQRG